VIAEADRRLWAQSLRAIAPLSDEELAEVAGHLATLELERGTAFLRAGETPKVVGVLVSGVLREAFVLADGTERTRSFAIEGGLAGSLSDLLRGGPARTTVVAEESSRIVSVEWSVVRATIARSAAWKTLLQLLTERLYLLKSDREWELLGLDAEERYQVFRTRYPGLEARVTQRHVASYLGITPEHLSRIRARTHRSS